MRGSAKHLLDLLESKDYCKTMNELLNGWASIDSKDTRQPSGNANNNERSELEIPAFCKGLNPSLVDHGQVSQWWLPVSAGSGTRGATWDLLSTCTIQGKRGLLLVEAKAHEDELSYAGKLLSSTASIQSKCNHEHIRKNLREASDRLNQFAGGVFALSIDGHYQLANRIAWAWKLAECGVPVILLYLGFTGDKYFNGDYLKDADHWQRAMGAYMNGVFPKGLPGTPIPGENGVAFTFLVKSLPIFEIST